MVLRPLPLNITSSFRSFWMLWHTHTMGLDIVQPLVSHSHTSPILFLTNVTCFNDACSLLCGWPLYNSPVSLVRSTQPFQFLVLSSFSLRFRVLTRKASGKPFSQFLLIFGPSLQVSIPILLKQIVSVTLPRYEYRDARSLNRATSNSATSLKGRYKEQK